MSGKALRTIHLNANEHKGYWQLRVSFDNYDREGTADEILTIRKPAQIPDTDDAYDQCWLVLVTAVHMIEEAGASGRIAGGDWPALFRY
jgi:hypothetical protein